MPRPAKQIASTAQRVADRLTRPPKRTPKSGSLRTVKKPRALPKSHWDTKIKAAASVAAAKKILKDMNSKNESRVVIKPKKRDKNAEELARRRKADKKRGIK